MSQENYDSAGVHENARGAYKGDGTFENDPHVPVPPEAGEGGEWVCSVQQIQESPDAVADYIKDWIMSLVS